MAPRAKYINEGPRYHRGPQEWVEIGEEFTPSEAELEWAEAIGAKWRRAKGKPGPKPGSKRTPKAPEPETPVEESAE